MLLWFYVDNVIIYQEEVEEKLFNLFAITLVAIGDLRDVVSVAGKLFPVTTVRNRGIVRNHVKLN